MTVIYLELIFVYGARCELVFIFVHIVIQLFQLEISWKDCPFSSELPLQLCQNFGAIYMSVFLWILFEICLFILVVLSVFASGIL